LTAKTRRMVRIYNDLVFSSVFSKLMKIRYRTPVLLTRIGSLYSVENDRRKISFFSCSFILVYFFFNNNNTSKIKLCIAFLFFRRIIHIIQTARIRKRSLPKTSISRVKKDKKMHRSVKKIVKETSNGCISGSLVSVL
jgi:hypothetical protein